MSQRLGGKVQTYNAFVAGFNSNDEWMLELNEGNLSRLERFQMRTLSSVGPPQTKDIFVTKGFPLLFQNPFLMHIVQSLTSIHDRYLSEAPDRRTTDELYHWTMGTSLFNKKLSAPVPPDDRDALWAAATLLGVITFASIEGGELEKAWPFQIARDPEPEWLKMSHGKAAILQMADPERPNSIFHDIFPSHTQLLQLRPPVGEDSLTKVFPGFIELFELDTNPTERNPYAAAIVSLCALSDIQSTPSAGLLFYTFCACINNEFGDLVLNRDPRALVVMAYWYSKMCMGPWWLKKRALIEGQATCVYLERFYGHDAVIQDLLEIPKRALFKNQKDRKTDISPSFI
jgi:hypothetical protein